MSLERSVLIRRDGLEMRSVSCRPTDTAPSPVEEGDRAVLILPTAGVFRLHLGRTTDFLLDPVRAVFLPPGLPHRYSHPNLCGDECLALELSPERLAALLDEIDPATADRERQYLAQPVFLAPRALAAARLLPRRLWTGQATDLEVDETIADLVTAWTQGLAGRASGPRDTTRYHRALADGVQLALAADPGRPWRLEELARLLASSPCHLTTVFRRVTGAPIHRTLLRMRLARGFDEILDGGRTVTEIAADLGFSTPSHFSAAFRNAFGSSPSVLRARSTKEFDGAATAEDLPCRA